MTSPLMLVIMNFHGGSYLNNILAPIWLPCVRQYDRSHFLANFWMTYIGYSALRIEFDRRPLVSGHPKNFILTAVVRITQPATDHVKNDNHKLYKHLETKGFLRISKSLFNYLSMYLFTISMLVFIRIMAANINLVYTLHAIFYYVIHRTKG